MYNYCSHNLMYYLCDIYYWYLLYWKDFKTIFMI